MSGPTQFGKYTLLRKIATGGMAEIFLAKQAGFGDIERFIVIKRILPHLTESPEFIRMFIDEMRVAAFLNHPNVVQIHDVGSVGGQYFIAMEYLEGRDLRKIMRKAASRGEVVPMPFAIKIITEVCEGLHYAHHRSDNHGRPLNLIHRDVSPQNIMATVQGAVKVLDFGIAKAESQLNETQAGVLKGKYSYMSPEQARGTKLDGRSDIFAIGTILYELTTGRRLFKHANEVVVLKMVSDADVPFPSSIDSGYPYELEQIVMRALSRRPTDRHSSCREMSQQLQEFAIPRRLMMSASEVGDYITELFADEMAEMNPANLPIERSVDQKIVSFLNSPSQAGQNASDPRESQPSLGSYPSGASHPSQVNQGALAGRNTPSFPSLLEQNVDPPEENTVRTGSLSVLAQRAKRRPFLTAVIATGFASVIVLVVLGLTLDLGQAIGQNGGNLALNSIKPSDLIKAAQNNDEEEIFGVISVSSTPTGARVFIDGEEQEGRTPLKIQSVTVGPQHFVVAEIDGETAQARRITLEREGELAEIEFNFSKARQPAKIVFENLPEGSDVRIDGQSRSDGNFSFEPGVDHSLVVALGDQELLNREIKSSAGETLSIKVDPPRKGTTKGVIKRPSKPGSISISSNPVTKVFLGNLSLGQTPVEREVPSGTYRMKLVNRSLLLNYSQRIKINPGQTVSRNITIPMGVLRISARPHAEVSINGVRQGRTPLKKRLYAGRYSVVLTNNELGRRERRSVRISGGSDERVRIDWRE